jgi:hypothetical protein
MKVWKMVKNRLAFFGNLAFLADVLWLDAHQSVVGERRERAEIIEGLVGEVVPVGEEEYAWSTSGLRSALPLFQVPACVEELPRDLKSDGRLSGACRQC